MGTILASKIVNDVEDILADTGNAVWSVTKLLKWLNVTQRTAAILKPDISVTTASVVLVAGVAQSVPAGGTSLIRLTWNMGVAPGTTVGAPISFIEIDALSQVVPNWTTVTASATVIHYMWDERNPKTFYVYPQQPTSAFGYVNMIYASPPADISAIGLAITLDDIYEPVLIEGTCYLAYLENSAHSPYAFERAQWHWNQFVTLLGRKDLIEKQDSPRPFRISTSTQQ